MTSQQIEHMIGFAKNAGYNYSTKQQFEKLSLKLLREVRMILGGKSNADMRVSFNPGGIAVSGEAILHSDRVYIQISGGFSFTCLVRAVTGKQDYTGAANHYYPEKELIEFGAKDLAAYAKSIFESHTKMDWSKTPHCNACGNRA